MKTHIFLAIFISAWLSGCASNEGRRVSSTEETKKQQLEYSKHEGNAGREFSRQ